MDYIKGPFPVLNAQCSAFNAGPGRPLDERGSQQRDQQLVVADQGDPLARAGRGPAPSASPDTCGCMWMMSVPIATWTVIGMLRRWAAMKTLTDACGG